MRVHVIMEHDLGEPHRGEHGAHAMPCTAHEVRTRGTWSHTVRIRDATYCAEIFTEQVCLHMPSQTVWWQLFYLFIYQSVIRQRSPAARHIEGY